MQLLYNRPSPYARKVLVTAHESGLVRRIELQQVDPWADPPNLLSVTPVGKVPALLTDSGQLITESTAICEYLFEKAGREPLSRSARVDEMARVGLAQGVIDAAFTFVIERRRPIERQWDHWIERQRRVIERTLVAMVIPPEGRFDLGDISLACGLSYLDFRLSELGWRSLHPCLAEWLDWTLERPSMMATEPQQ